MLLPDAATAAALRAPDRDRRGPSSTSTRSPSPCVSIGSWEPGISTVHDMLSDEERAHYASLGVAAEMSAHLFDADGRRVGRDLGERCITVEADRLRRIPEVVAIAGGTRKAAAIDAVLRSGLVTSLVTDTVAADHLLATTSPPRRRPRPPRTRRGGRSTCSRRAGGRAGVGGVGGAGVRGDSCGRPRRRCQRHDDRLAVAASAHARARPDGVDDRQAFMDRCPPTWAAGLVRPQLGRPRGLPQRPLVVARRGRRPAAAGRRLAGSTPTCCRGSGGS